MYQHGLKELKALSLNLKQSVLPISDGVLIRTLMDVGYVSYYKSRGYLGMSVMIPMEDLFEKESEAEKANREYEEYLVEEAEKQ